MLPPYLLALLLRRHRVLQSSGRAGTCAIHVTLFPRRAGHLKAEIGTQARPIQKQHRPSPNFLFVSPVTSPEMHVGQEVVSRVQVVSNMQKSEEGSWVNHWQSATSSGTRLRMDRGGEENNATSGLRQVLEILTHLDSVGGRAAANLC